mmetsp:Transcript_100/g.466  ORF Transcript_100/g.466 Transcript_100/m.466 type:complete len:515 (-) Transcript_100:423-1967(-)
MRDDPERRGPVVATDISAGVIARRVKRLVRVRGRPNAAVAGFCDTAVRDGDHHLDGEGARDGRQARARHRALLVQGSVGRGIPGRDDVVAEVAPEASVERAAAALVGRLMRLGAFIRSRQTTAVSHDQVRVEPQRGVDEELSLGGAHERGEPPALPRVREQVHAVVRVDEVFQPPYIVEHGRHVGVGHGVSGHRNRHPDALGVHPGEDPPQRFSRRLRLRLTPAEAVLELEQRLANRIGEGHVAAVHERHSAHAPPEQTPGDGASQRSGAEQQTPRRRDLGDSQLRQQPPSHELEVQVDRLGREPRRVHRRPEVRQPRSRSAARVDLPADALRIFDVGVRDDGKDALEHRGRAGAHAPGEFTHGEHPNAARGARRAGGFAGRFGLPRRSDGEPRQDVSQRPTGMPARRARIDERQRPCRWIARSHRGDRRRLARAGGVIDDPPRARRVSRVAPKHRLASARNLVGDRAELDVFRERAARDDLGGNVELERREREPVVEAPLLQVRVRQGDEGRQ